MQFPFRTSLLWASILATEGVNGSNSIKWVATDSLQFGTRNWEDMVPLRHLFRRIYFPEEEW
eukprot:12563258-Ditylum_brightwellii.AAC.1